MFDKPNKVLVMGGYKYIIVAIGNILLHQKFRFRGKWWQMHHQIFSELKDDINEPRFIESVFENKNFEVAIPLYKIAYPKTLPSAGLSESARPNESEYDPELANGVAQNNY